eukprot:CAMPEP_0201286004 /NCGR_PEP_ID=MMETSP1317-20130820/114145_1 /ASSEMBLY_ACC=CAM_ASM_000770 /TAXON_ID=187299 /ORGANISM="Undescribed Undescribed, Strain Undescribed" /LENGTH=34 /DNA_ID= /DNA_START= /DNA_END= /DNA_ORIENTATION=
MTEPGINFELPEEPIEDIGLAEMEVLQEEGFPPP